jgi:hypothetical protein
MYNRSNSTCENVNFVEHKNATKWSVLFVGVIIVMFTVIFNITVIVKINRKRKLKTFARFFLTSLASVDLCVGVTIMPVNIVNELYGLKQTAGMLFCDILNTLDYMLSTASIFFLTILTFDRYIALCKPFEYHRLCNKRMIVIITFSTWLFIIAIAFGIIPTGMVYYGVPEDILFCVLKEEKACVFLMSKYFAVLSSTISILVPVITITYLNVQLACHIRRQSNISAKIGLNGSTTTFIDHRHTSQGVHVAKTIAVLTISFLFCWVPFFIVLNISVFSEYTLSYGIYVVANWLGYLNSTINPFLYILLERKSCIGRH